MFDSAIRLPPFPDALNARLQFRLQSRIERDSALEILFGFGVLALTQQSQSAVHVSQGVARMEFDGSVEVIDRPIQFISVAHYQRAAEIARGEARIERKSLVEILQRAVAVPLRAPSKAAIEIDRREARIDHEGAVKIGEGAIELFLIHIQVAAIVVGLRVARIDRDGAVEINKRPIVLLQGITRDAAIVVGVVETRIDHEGAVAVGDRALVIAESITREPAIGICRRRQRVKDFDPVELRRLAVERRIPFEIAIVRARADLDGFGEIGDRALEIAFLIERTASVEMVVRGARRLSQTQRREKAQSYRSLRDSVKFHTQLSSEKRHVVTNLFVT